MFLHLGTHGVPSIIGLRMEPTLTRRTSILGWPRKTIAVFLMAQQNIESAIDEDLYLSPILQIR